MQGKIRMTFLGDSFTAGHGIADVEKRFSNRIRSLRRGWEVHVFGYNGLDSIDELDFLSNRVPPGYYFENVVLVYTLNDISKVMPEWEVFIKKVYDDDAPALFSQSYFLDTLYYRWKRSRISEISNFYHFTRAAYENAVVWQPQQVILQKIKDQVEARGGNLLVVTFPFVHSLGKNYEFRDVHRQLDEFWRKQGVPHLDLLDVFESHLPEKFTVNANDAHPNERAHTLAADAIMSFLDAHLDAKAK
jgi:lysophospholipase L1-like esterase